MSSIESLLLSLLTQARGDFTSPKKVRVSDGNVTEETTTGKKTFLSLLIDSFVVENMSQLRVTKAQD